MAMALQIPTQNVQVCFSPPSSILCHISFVQARQVLDSAFNELLIKGTERRPNEVRAKYEFVCQTSLTHTHTVHSQAVASSARVVSTLSAIDSDRLV